MDRPDELGRLQTGDWGRIQDLADRFEQSWQKAQATASSADLNSLLPGAGDPMRSAVLYELIKIDMEFRWRKGQIITLDHYLERYPELGAAENLSPSLVYEEYRLSQLHGVNTPLNVYQKRFPKQFEELEKLIQAGHQQTHASTEPQAGSKASGFGSVEKPSASNNPPPNPSGLASPNPLGATHDAGSMVGGGYRLDKRIGSGAFGEVWRATAPGGVEVAVKIIFRPLDNEEAKSELQAMELIKTLRHPFLLQTHAFWPEQDRLLIVMELADGSLRDRLKQCRKVGLSGIPPSELLTYFREAAEALDYLHGKRLLHRDIKPDNILLSERHAKVADFGLARLMSTRRSAKVTGSGTPAYMAPEMWASQVNQFSDQYCLATSYAELRLAKPLFQGQDIIQLMRAHLQDTPNLSGLPAKERDVLLTALAKDPLKRYRTCGEFMEALEEVVETGKAVRRDLSHVPAGGNQQPVPAPHPSLIHNDPMDFAGTLRPGATIAPVLPPPAEPHAGAPPSSDTDSTIMPTLAAASGQVLERSSSPARNMATPASAPSARPPSWKDTVFPGSPDTSPTAPSPGEPSWKVKSAAAGRGKKPLVLGAAAALAVCGLLGFLFWNAGASLKAETAKLAEQGQFDQALARVDQASFWTLSFARTSARDHVRVLWLSQVRRFQDNENFDEEEQAATALLQRFPEDEKAATLLDTALKHSIPPLATKGEFASAFQRLSAASPKSKVRDSLLDELKNKWRDQAQKELKAGAYAKAQKTAEAMLASFKEDNQADGIRRKAHFEIIAPEVRKLKQAQEYDVAFRRLAEETPFFLAEDASRLRKEVDDDQGAAFKQLMAKVQSDLAAAQYDAALDKLKGAEHIAHGDNELATIRKLRIQAGSGPVEPLLKQAAQQLAAGDFSDCQQTARQGLQKLNVVNSLARKDVEGRLDVLLVLSWAKDPKRADKDSEDILKRLRHLLDQDTTPRLADLAKAYVQIAEKHREWQADAPLVRAKLAKLSPADRADIQRAMDGWGMPITSQALGDLLTKARALYDKGDYQGCLDQLGFDMALLTDAGARNEYRALRALSAAVVQPKEALRWLMDALDEGGTVRQDELAMNLAKIALDQPDYQKRVLEILDKVLPGLSRTSSKDRAESYVAYLNGLADRDANKLVDAANDMLRAYVLASEPLLAPQHVQAAADILRTAAEGLPAGEDTLKPFATPDDAGKAYQWLTKAQQLLTGAKQELPPSALVQLALAASLKPEPDRMLARQLADQLVVKPGPANLGPAALPLLLVRAQAQATPESAIVAYAGLLTQFKKADRNAVPAKSWFSSILAPAIVVGDGIANPLQKPAPVKAALAKCYASYARFLREHLYDDEWLPKSPKQKALDYYGKAVKLDDVKPEYWIGYAYSQAALANVDWSEVEKDTRKALELGPHDSSAYGLRGYLYLLQSRRDAATDRTKQLEELRLADGALAKALDLAKMDEEDKSSVLLNRSITDLELGNYLSDKEVRKKYLYLARDFAEQASKLPHPYPDWVQEAWGNALEDIAMLLGETSAYPQAVAKFDKAIFLRRYQPRGYLARGRTQYRWVVLGGNKNVKVLESAMRDLEKAISYSFSKSPDAAQAFFWEGMIYRERRDLAKAREAFAQAIEVGTKYNGRDWAMMARQQNVQIILAEARALIRTRPEQTMQQADEAARLVEQVRQDYGGTEAARLLIDIYRLKADAGLELSARTKDQAKAKALQAVQDAAAKIQANGDPAQADLLRGLAYETQDDIPNALDVYNHGLEQKQIPDNIRGQLLINRATIQARPDSKVARADILKDLAVAVKLVPDAYHKASALALDCLLNTWEAIDANAANPRQSRTDAIKSGREAIKYAGNTHPDRAVVRYWLANNLLSLAMDTEADKMKMVYLNEGLERARQAKQMENLLGLGDRQALDNLLVELRNKKAEVEGRLNQGG